MSRFIVRFPGAMILLFAAFLATFPVVADAASVVSFSPTGTVRKVRQATARFDEPMVAFGDPRLSDPFAVSVTGGAKGAGRWVDSRNWVFDFDADLSAGVVATFTLVDGVTAADGTHLSGARAFTFDTGGPSIVGSWPSEGRTNIEEAPVFVLRLDAPAAEATVVANASFSAEGIGEAIGVDVVKGEARKAIILSLPRYYSLRADDPTIILVKPRRTFPSGAKVELLWGRGVATPWGIANIDDQFLRFQVREPFSVRFSCEREEKGGPCIPVLPMEIRFSSSVPRALAEKIVLRKADGVGRNPKMRDVDSNDNDAMVQAIEFPGPFPEKTKFRIELPPGFKDDSGRVPSNGSKFPLAVETGGYPTLAKFAAPFGIVEWVPGAALPVTVRNIEASARLRNMPVGEGAVAPATGVPGRLARIPAADRSELVVNWLRRVAAKDGDWEKRGASLLSAEKGANLFTLPQPTGEKSFEVVGILLDRPGFYVVEIESRALGRSLLGGKDGLPLLPGKEEPMFVPAAALVTGMSVHFKKGRESSLVWVTTLADANPVPDAKVEVRDPTTWRLLWSGSTDGSGIARITTPLPKLVRPDQYNGQNEGYFVTASKDDDFSFAFSEWNEGIEPWRFSMPTGGYDGADDRTAHTVFSRSLLRAGETVQMKHLIRTRTMDGFGLPKAMKPQMLIVSHIGSDQQYDFPLVWRADGSAETEWDIPRDAKLGVYETYLGADGLRSGEFRVEEFRVPLMRGSVRDPGGPRVAAKSVDLDLQLAFLSGGGAGNAPVVVRTAVEPRRVSFPDADDFAFATGMVEEGRVRSGARHRQDDDAEVGEAGEGTDGRPTAKSAKVVLDAGGGARTTVDGLGTSDIPRDLVAEMEYADPNGEAHTVSTRVPLWPSSVVVGIRPDGWMSKKDDVRATIAVVGTDGRPLKGVPVTVDLFQTKRYSHRKRLVGGFYSYDDFTETKKAGRFCSGTTDALGFLHCRGASPVGGEIIFQARAVDAKGNASFAKREIFVADPKDEGWWFRQADHDRIDLLPEKKSYEPGETAVFQVRMPFAEATALVTVEREGVGESFVTRLTGADPTIKVKVTDAHSPNVYVSALVVRGRVTDAKPTALADLGRPSFRLGVASIRVGWGPHALKVRVSADREVYRTREVARVSVKVVSPNGAPLPAGAEVAVAAVDEGLLELMPNRSWNLLDAMMGTRPWEVATSTAQMQVIGKRHFGRKALPAGGGGGRSAARELFDTLLLWKGHVALDANGEATVEVPLNDSLTSFRIVAVATAGTGLFGTGETTIRATRDLSLFAGLPPVVREGDDFRATFTLRNGSTKPIATKVSAAVASSVPVAPLPERTVDLAPGEAKEVAWEVKVPVGAVKLDWAVSAVAGEGTDDGVKASQKVVPSVPTRVLQATFARLAPSTSFPANAPSDAVPGKGGVAVSLSPRITQGLAGVRLFMREYPYSCMEQRVSRAVALRDSALWASAMADLPSHLDGDGLAKFFPTCWQGSDTLTAYLLALSHESGWTIPEEPRARMIRGLTGFVEGRVVRHGAIRTADLTLRRLAAVEALSRHGVAKARHLEAIDVAPNLWPTSGVIDWLCVLGRVTGIPREAERTVEALAILRSRMTLSGTTIGFSTEQTDRLWWLMTDGDVNAVRAMLLLYDRDGWEEEAPKMARGAIGRQIRGAWGTTVANAWGVLALEKFSARYEKEPVGGTTRASLDKAAWSLDWSASKDGGSTLLPWPTGTGGGATLSIDHEGAGSPWAMTSSHAAVTLTKPFFAGYKVKRTVTAVSRREASRWSKGDVARVRLEIDAQADMTWVAVTDPIPAGSTILGSGLGGDSALSTKGERSTGAAWSAFAERGFESYREYFEYVPKGVFAVEYTVRLNNPGTFLLPPTRVEALYAPELFGEAPNAPVTVVP